MKRKEKLIPVDCTNWPKQNPKYYTYAYMQGSVIKYVGKGSDGNLGKKKRFNRAKDIIEGHNQSCGNNIDTITSIKIIGGFDEADKCTMNEAANIKFFNLLNEDVGWNKRDEMIDPKFYAMLEILDGNNSITDIPTMIHYMMQGATGSNSVETEKLATELLQYINFDHRKILLIGNDGFGGYNLLKYLIEIQENTPREIFSLVSQQFLIKIGVDGMMDKKALKVQTGVESFLDPGFRETGDIFIMNPPFKENGIQFIEKAANLMRDGDKMVCIMATDMFSPMPLEEIGQPGTFSWLNQKGKFERIELYRSSKVGNMPLDRVTFKGITATCWFVWSKGIRTEGETQITNTMDETFQYQLTGKETKIPMEPWEKIKSYVNWDINTALNFIQTDANTKRFKKPEVKLGFKLYTDRIESTEATDTGRTPILILKNDPDYKIDESKFKQFMVPDIETASRNKTLYSKKIDTAINHYPLNKEYFRLKE